jgi:magnesium-transporting ATPase (P-type)
MGTVVVQGSGIGIVVNTGMIHYYCGVLNLLVNYLSQTCKQFPF